MSSPPRKHRYPKPGTGFLLIRLIGWGLQIVGWLLIAAALVGFIAVLVKMGPTLLEAFQFSEQKMAGLVIIGVLAWLFVFMMIGFGGVVLLVIGFAFGRWGTEPAPPASLQSSTASTPAQQAGPD